MVSWRESSAVFYVTQGLTDAPVEAVNHSLASVRAHLVELKQCLLPEVADRLVKLLAARISALVISSTIETRKFTDSGASLMRFGGFMY